jgi:hypothetical protein
VPRKILPGFFLLDKILKEEPRKNLRDDKRFGFLYVLVFFERKRCGDEKIPVIRAIHLDYFYSQHVNILEKM